jgi:hypothetical protein
VTVTTLWITLAAVVGGFSGVVFSEEEVPTSRSTRSSKSSSGSNANLEKKLDEILAKQETILQKFDTVMEELRIIKVRTSIQ